MTRQRMGMHTLLLVTLTWSSLIGEVLPKSQYVMPMAMGMKMSIPYDIANIFTRPIAGVIGVGISIALLLIIFFGMITSPFGYFFGIPSRKYVLGEALKAQATPRFLPPQSFLERLRRQEFYPSFPHAFFYGMDPADLEVKECQLLALCYAHAGFRYVPQKLLKVYTLFSGKLSGLAPDFREAIVRGLHSNVLCGDTYAHVCPHSAFSLIVKTLLALLPDRFKDEHFRRRKQDMYM